MDSKQSTAVDNATPGAIDHGEGWVSFAIYAPDKKSVHLIGSFNDWNHERTPLEQKEPGYWLTAFQLEKGTYEYQFLIDGELIICDPYAHWIAPNEKDSDQPRAIIEVGAEPYKWEHDDWMRPELHDMIIYEIHIGDFTEEGTFAAATEKLDHLKDLGISGIQLMPICEAAPDDYWGYKPTFLMAPRRTYGSPDDFADSSIPLMLTTWHLYLIWLSHIQVTSIRLIKCINTRIVRGTARDSASRTSSVCLPFRI